MYVLIGHRKILQEKQNFSTKIVMTVSGLNFQKDDSPCDNCEKPCIRACPVEALTVSNYDDNSCRDFVVKSEEDSCSTGCLVRRSCPVGHGLRRPEQSKFHMSYFIKNL